MNTDYKCPYCKSKYTSSNKLLKNWKSVRAHTSNCKLNTKEFTICEYYGPISFTTINSYTNIASFKKDYPYLSFSEGIFKQLRKHNKIKLKEQSWDTESIIKAILEFYTTEKYVPTARNFDSNPKYPSRTTVTKYFESWNTAIEAAGLISNFSTYGKTVTAKDGNKYRSALEAHFVNEFLMNKYEYNYEVFYPNKLWLYDFYLPKLDLYIEVNGLIDTPEYAQKLKDKISFNKKEKRNLLVISKYEIYASPKREITDLIKNADLL